MNAENTKALVESFPVLYCGADRPRPTDSAPRFFFECRDGWFNLIFRLSEKLERSARRCGAAADSTDWPRALQVKEKYGTLRFYVMPSTDEFSRLIDEAEKQSARTCELFAAGPRSSEKRDAGIKPFVIHAQASLGILKFGALNCVCAA